MSELKALASELRARTELFDELDWSGPAARPAKPAAAVAPPAVPAVASQAPADVPARLAELVKLVAACQDCPLGKTRIKPAFGVGPHTARVMFVGEGPGFAEDHQGEPFVGKAGQLLDKIMASIGLSRQTNAYIANVVKCHPMIDPSNPEKRGNDRPPSPDEMAACRHYLDEQINLIQPKAIVALGGVAAKALLNTTTGITSLRGKWREYHGIRLLPTFHPAALLRDPNLKRDVWEDMKSLKAVLEETT